MAKNLISSTPLVGGTSPRRCRTSIAAARTSGSGISYFGLSSWSSKPSPIPSQHHTSSKKIGTKPWTLPMTNSLKEEIKIQYPISTAKQCLIEKNFSSTTHLNATLRSPRGFGPSPKKRKKTPKKKTSQNNDNDDEEEDEEEEEEEDEREEGVIPEIVTNRMIGRMGFTVGAPLFLGLLFFPFFYYLKVGLKIDVPTWVPFIVSFAFFGTALLGVSYGIVSSSWDPMREGSLLGWTEAQKNWPVFWQSLRGGSKKD